MGSMEGGVYPEEVCLLIILTQCCGCCNSGSISPRMIQWFQNGQFPMQELVKFYPVSHCRSNRQRLSNLVVGTGLYKGR